MSRNLRLSLIMDAAGNATRFLKGVHGETEATSKALRAARERLQELKASSRDVASYRRMTDSLGQTRQNLKAAREEAARLAKAHAATTTPTKQLTRAFELAKIKVRELKKAEESQRHGLQALRGKLDEAGLSAKRLSASEARLASDTRRANAALHEQRDKLEKLKDRQDKMRGAREAYDKRQQFAGTAAGAGASAIGAGMAVAAPLVLGAKAAISFQDAMLDVRKVVDFDTPEQFAEMNRDVRNLSRDLGLPAEGVAQIIAAAGQAKIPREELRGFARDAGQMGVAFGTTAEDAGQKMATWRTAFAMTQDQVRSFADQINYLGDNGNATAMQISDVVTRVGPLAGVAGAAASEVAALGSTIVGFGVAEEIAATGIKNTMLALTKGEAATKSQQKAYAALGLEAKAVAKAMQMDAGGTIVDVLERVRGLSVDRQAAVLTQLFGSESVGAIAPVLTQLDVLKTNLEAVADSQKTAGSMAVEFANRQSGVQGAADQAVNGLKAAASAAGEPFLAPLREGALALVRMSEHFQAFAEKHPGLITVIGTLVGVIAGALLVFGGLVLAVAAILGPFALLQFSLAMAGPMFAPVIAGALGAAQAFAAWGLAMLANPVTWIVLGIVAAVALLAGGAYLLFKNWGRVTAFFGRLWDGVSRAVAGGVAWITDALVKWSPLGPIVRNWSAVADVFSALWRAMAETVGLGLDLIKLAILRFTPLGFILRNWQPITGFMSGLWTGLQHLVGLGLDVLRALFFNFTPLGLVIRNWSGVTGYIGSVWSSARSAVSTGIGAIKSAIANFAPLNDFKSAFAQVWTWMKDLPAKLMSAGADAMRGFTQGIRGQRDRVQAAAAEAAGRAETGARRRLDTHSPSRVFAAIGGDVMDGFALGVQRGSGSVVGRMRTAAAAVAAAGAVTVAAPTHAAPLNSPAGVRSTVEEPPASFRLGAAPPDGRKHPTPAADIVAPAAVVSSPALDYAALAAALKMTAVPTVVDHAPPLETSGQPSQLDLSAILRTAEAALGQRVGNGEAGSGDRSPAELARPRDFAPAVQSYPTPPPRPGRPSIGSVTLHVYAQPGQDAQEIAQEVMRLMQDPNNAAFEDDGEGFD
ncbi:phage tail tape measure protein [Brevundimonas diminuta]|uniref:phage tail tape measure protein n=1 Tax=Brevundimonas diminuta TaxID=293 RepID=UPI003D045007